MSGGAATVPAGEAGPPLGRLLARLMAGRLAIAIFVFALALSLVGAGKRGAGAMELGLYGTLTFWFVSIAASAALLARVRRLELLGALQLATDLAAVTSILFFTEGARSIFSFLYLPITLYAAILYERRGAYATAVISSACFAGMLALGALGSLAGETGSQPFEWALGVWGVHTGALLLVAMLASALVRDRRLADARLETNVGHLRELQTLHERTVESLTSGLLTLEVGAHISSCNPEATRILDCTRAEIEGRPAEDVIPGLGAILQRSGQGRMRSRLPLVLASGAQRFLGVAASLLRNSRGEPVGHVVIFQDVTEVVTMERELRHRERLAAVGELAAGVAHEVRNPLAAISGCVEMLRALNRDRTADAEQDRLMGIVLREIERLDALIADFLQFARPGPPKLEAVALRPLLEEVAEMCRAACPVGVRVEVAAPAGLVARADPTQLRQVLWNLVRNAVQALGERGNIRLCAAPAPRALSQADSGSDRSGTAERGDAVEIVVADDGPGIAPEALERIFDPFFTTKPAGSGLGLATVHRIVTAHGGSVGVLASPGGGASFRVLLPENGEPA